MPGTTYLAGPMRKIPFFNFPAFYKAAGILMADGHFVLNPAEHDEKDLLLDPRKFPNGEFSDAGWSPERSRAFLRMALRWDFDAIWRSDTIALLPGWEKSEGAQAELAYAKLLGLDVLCL